MSNKSNKSKFSKIPIFNGTNYLDWFPKMMDHMEKIKCGYLWLSEGQTAPNAATNPQNFKIWQQMNEKACRSIHSKLSPVIAMEFSNKKVAREIMEAITASYSTVSVSEVYANFTALMHIQIPTDKHPAEALANIEYYFHCMNIGSVHTITVAPIQASFSHYSNTAHTN